LDYNYLDNGIPDYIPACKGFRRWSKCIQY